MEKPIDVVIIGAGPAGLLLANYLLTFGNKKYNVAIYERGDDPRVVHSKGPSTRRYSMGLCKRGMLSMDAIPGLVDKVKEVLVESTQSAIFLFGKPRITKVAKNEYKPFLVDRVALCARLFEALVDSHGASGQLKFFFGQACTGVDLAQRVVKFSPVENDGTMQGASMEGQGRRQLVQGATRVGEQHDVPYELLVGADGLRSPVRQAMAQQSRCFQAEVRDIFNEWTVTHIPTPPAFAPNTLHIIPKVPGASALQGIGLPIHDGHLCFLWGWPASHYPREFAGVSTPQEAKAFVDARVPHMAIPEAAAWELLHQAPKTSMQVKCWQYHDTEGSCVLVGDAAHATSPAIGQGCNASLSDAAVLGRLLVGVEVGEGNRIPQGAPPQPTALSAGKLRARLPAVMERYSALQVKEGHALVDMSWSGAAFNKNIQVLQMLYLIVVSFLYRLLPWLVTPPLQTLCTSSLLPYHEIKKMHGWTVDYVRRSNDAIRDEYLERKSEEVLKQPVD